MGVEGVFPFLKSEGIEGSVVDTKTFLDPIHVDVLSLYRSYIISTETSIKTRLNKKEFRQPNSTANDNPLLYLGKALDARLSRQFRKTKDILHFDGTPTQQKHWARGKRLTHHQAQVNKANGLFDSVFCHLPSPSTTTVVSHDGAPQILCTRSRRQKVIKLSKIALEKWKYARGLEPATLTSLVGTLTTSGWTVCQCRHEADICISRQGPIQIPGQQPIQAPGPVQIRGQPPIQVPNQPRTRHAVVASSDSDFLFHNVRILLRQDPRSKNTFHRFDVMTDVIQRLGITEAVWLSTAIVSNNDYSRSFFRQSFPKILRVMDHINNANLYNGTARVDQLLSSYCRAKNPHLLAIYNAHNQPSIDIFQRWIESPAVGIPAVDNGSIDGRVASMMLGIELLFRQYKAYHRAIQAPAPPHGAHAAANLPASPTASVDGIPPPRPFLKYMPPNNYRPKEITFGVNTNDESDSGINEGSSSDDNSNSGDNDNTNSSSAKKPQAKKKNPNKRGPPKYNKSSRKKRRITGDGNDDRQGTPKSKDPTGAIDDILNFDYGTISMDFGTLKTQLSKGIESNMKGHRRKKKVLRRIILKTIQDMVRIGTDVIIIAQNAIAHYIALVTLTYPTLSQQDIDARKADLQLLSVLTTKNVFGYILQDIFQWHHQGPTQGRARSTTARETLLCDRILTEYNQALQSQNLNIPDVRGYVRQGLGPFLQLAALTFADQFQGHYYRNISELVARLENHNPEWCSSHEGQSVLTTIASTGNREGTSTVHDQISLFWILNTHLPASQQMTFIPESGFKDRFFNITERMTVTALMSNAPRQHKPFIEEIFGTSQDRACSHTVRHRGDLFYNLFFHRGFSYFRNTYLMNPESADSQPYFRHDSKEALLNLTDGEQSEMEEIFSGVTNPTNEQKSWVARMIRRQLYPPEMHKEMIDNPLGGNFPDNHSGNSRLRRYVLTGTLVTNGYELKILAYSLTKKRPPKILLPNTTHSKLKSILTELSTDRQVDTKLPNTDYIVAGIDPGIRSTATATILRSSTLESTAINMSISQGSQTFSSRQYLKELNKAKQKKTFARNGQQQNVNHLEISILAVACRQAITNHQRSSWILLARSIKRHVISVARVQEDLRSFYGSFLFKMKTRHLKQAKQAVLNKGVNNLFNATGCSEKWDMSQDRVLFAVGDGNFGSSKGPVLHQQFISFLKKKVGIRTNYKGWLRKRQ